MVTKQPLMPLAVLSVCAAFNWGAPTAAAQALACEQGSFPECLATCPVGVCSADLRSGTCVCPPTFPFAGTDLSPTVGILRVDVIGIGPVDAEVFGEVLLLWQDPQLDPASGHRTVQTEMLSMDLSGSHPDIGNMIVRAGSQFGLPATLGSVVPLNPGSEFPALATFDVFFEVEVQGVATLRNGQPLVMEAVIDEIPPRSIGLRNAAPVQLTDILDPTHVDTLQIGFHWMCPPPFPPPGIPCPVPCDQNPFPVCGFGDCPAGEECAPAPGGGRCRCQPMFPPVGTDLSPTVGILRVDVIGVGSVDAKVTGETLLQWQAPQTDPVSGERSVQTEILSMDLLGSHPSIGNMRVTAGTQFGLPATLGMVGPLTPDGDFPALASFDVFFEVDVQGVATLRNNQPLVMQADIDQIPPRNIGLRNAAPIQIADVSDPTHVDTLQIGFHWMCPPPFPPPGIPCPVPCGQNPYPVCEFGDCPPGQTCVTDDATGECRCVVPCEESGFPACGGACPPGTACVPGAAAAFCSCVPVSCEESAFPACGGECPSGTSCVPDNVSGRCRCRPDGLPCEESPFPDCFGDCPSGVTCEPVFDADVCRCTSDQPGVPTVSQWGVVATTALFALAGAWIVRRRRMAVG